MDSRRRVCVVPFQRFEVFTGPRPGDAPVFLCCGGWLKMPAGDLRRQSVEEIWNGPQAQEIRRSILDGSFRHCDRAQCPFLETQTGPLQYPEEIGDPDVKTAVLEGRTELPYGPKDLNCGYDKSCNLSCPSCRTEVIVDPPDNGPLQELHRKLEADALPRVEKITITGSGDPFGSPFFRKWLRGMDAAATPRLKAIHLQTNGQLWTREMWSSLSAFAREKIRTAEVSIDAATPGTYAINRRGGEFEGLLRSLEFIGALRKQGSLEWLKFNMVVQENNFREMPAFVSLARRYGADEAYFSRLTNWGTFSDEEFRRRAVFHEGHPSHREFLGVLRSDVFGDPLVRLGNLGPFRARALARKRWDLLEQEKEWYLSTLDPRRFRLRFLSDPRFVARRLAAIRSPGELARRAAGVGLCAAYGIQNGLYAARGWVRRAGGAAADVLRLSAEAGLTWSYRLQKRLYRRRGIARPAAGSAAKLPRRCVDWGLAGSNAVQDSLYLLRRWALRRTQPELERRPERGPGESIRGEGLFCERPFVCFEPGVGPGPAEVPVTLCCKSWLNRVVGDLRVQSVEQIWNGPQAQELRRSILDGSFRYCDATACPYLKSATGPVGPVQKVSDPEMRRVIDQGLVVLPFGPRELRCSFERSCNLSCPSCRKGLIVEKAESPRLDLIRRKLEREVLPGAQAVFIGGSGDALGSPFFMRWLESMDVATMKRTRYIFLHTNGQLWTPRLWNGLPVSVRALARRAEISIDAASPATYALNRRGGNFERLLENLEFIASLRRSGSLEALTISMVVQENNFREMPDFVRLGRRLEVDRVYFGRLVDWGTFSPEEYRRRAVHRPDHPNHPELLEVLQDTVLLDPTAFLGNLADLSDRRRAVEEPVGA